MQAPQKNDVVFFLSGAAALVYQVAWARLLARLTGSDSIGIALVLAVFMAGMGLGAWFFAERVRASNNPRRLFVTLLAIMAVWAAASPELLATLQPVDSLLTRGGVAALLLLVPTVIMGATFPLMGKLTIGDDAETGEGTAKFYGANTLGAAAGALLGAFVIFPLLGLSRGLYVGASLDLLAAILALGLVVPKRTGDAPEKEQPANPTLATSINSNFRSTALVLTFLFGASSLALEVLLTRLLITVTGASVFAFALVLAVYLLGIGIGGRRARLLLAREGGAQRLLESCAVWIPIVGFAGLIFLRYQLGESDLFGVLANRMPSGAATWLLWASQAFFAGLALFPPAYGFGLALPACTALIVESRGEWSRERAMGRLYAFNTAGATLGSLGAGFFLLPELGPRSSIAIAFAVAWLAAPLLGKAKQGGLARLAFPTAGALFLGWFALRPAPSDDTTTTLFHSVGRDSTVSVLETAASAAGHPGARSLLVNGKVVATTAPVDLRLQRLLGTIPAHLHREPKTALVIGLGTGMTAGALLDFPSLESLEIFEISSTVREGARHFEAWNSGVLNDARTHIQIADGRHALALSPERFDIVTSDPIHPWTRGSSDLYAVEHFRQMAAHLAPEGIASQWLPLYQLATEDVKTIVATWCAAFEHTSAWLSAYDLVLIGSNAPVPLADRLSQSFPPTVAANLKLAGIASWQELGALLVADHADLLALSDSSSPMFEDHPRLEFRAPLAYLSGYATEILAWAESSRPAVLPAESEARAREVRQLLSDFLTDLPNGLTAAADRYGQRLLALPPLE